MKIKTYGILAIITLAALVIRIYPVVSDKENIREGIGPYSDTLTYHALAYNLYRGNGFSASDGGKTFGRGALIDGMRIGIPSQMPGVAFEPAITRGPVYPFFISLIYRFLGDEPAMAHFKTWKVNWNRIRLVQTALDALLCIVVFAIVRIIIPQSAYPALFCALLQAFNVYGIHYSRALLTESVMSFILMLSLLFSLVGIKKDGFLWWGASGFLFGIAVLTRPEYLLLPIVICGYIFCVERKNMRLAVIKGLIYLLFFFVTVLPWTMRNHIVFEKVIPVASGGLGFSLYSATYLTHENWVSWNDMFPDEIFRSKEEKQNVLRLYNGFLYAVAGGSIRVQYFEKVFTKLALEQIKRNPVRVICNWIKQTPTLWFLSGAKYFKGGEPSGILSAICLMMALLSFPFAPGHIKKYVYFIALFPLYLTIIYLPLHVEARYSVPQIPAIMVLASIGCYLTVSYVRSGRRKASGQ